MSDQRQSSEAGFVGGLEVLPFGLLIFVFGSLLVVNAWAVVDAKVATSSAAREAARTYVESASAADGASRAQAAADEAIANYGRDPAKLVLTFRGGSFTRCERITFVASYKVPAISLPFGMGFGSPFEVTSEHSEIIDPLRSGLSAANSCGF